MPEYDSQPVRLIRQRFLRGTTIVLDNHVFEDCTFDGCTVEYHGGEYLFVGQQTFHLCAWNFLDAAGRTVKLAQLLCKSSPDIRSQLFPDLFPWDTSQGHPA